MALITDFRCPGGNQRLAAVLADGMLSVSAIDGRGLTPSSQAFADAVVRRHATIGSAERALRNNGVHEADSVLWRTTARAA